MNETVLEPEVLTEEQYGTLRRRSRACRAAANSLAKVGALSSQGLEPEKENAVSVQPVSESGERARHERLLKELSDIQRPDKVLVTVEMAKKWLSNAAPNRPIRALAVAKCVAEILEGEWKYNGDTIRFNKDGKMIDGQHRCKAIVETGMEQICLVAYDVDETAVPTIDEGTRRTSADQWGMKGLAGGKTDSAIIQQLYHWYVSGHMGTTRKTLSLRASWAVYNKLDLPLFTAVKARAYSTKGIHGKPSILAAIGYVAGWDNLEKFEDFVNRITTGLGMSRSDSAYFFREFLRSSKKNSGWSETIIAQSTAHAFSIFVSGKKPPRGLFKEKNFSGIGRKFPALPGEKKAKNSLPFAMPLTPVGKPE